VNPVAELCERARKRSITTLVDGAQSAGHMPVDVQPSGRFLSRSPATKSAGRPASACCGTAELLDAMPPYQGAAK